LTWRVEWDDRARRELRRVDPRVQRSILRYFSERIATCEDPRRLGKPLRHELKGLWRYRIGDYRAI
jgi:mRNA interferase RelE/StbE